MNEQEMRTAIVEEAKAWIGTRWMHAHDTKGVGVDCAMLLVRVFVDAGMIPPFDPRPYPQQWFMHRETPMFLNILGTHGHKVEAALPGDVAMYNFGKHAAHGAIIVDDEYMIHAYMPARKVLLDTRRAMSNEFDSYWSLF